MAKLKYLGTNVTVTLGKKLIKSWFNANNACYK